MSEAEFSLIGGNVATSVVRSGATVRKPATAATSNVKAFLDHLQQEHFSACPKHFGLDEQGRQILEYIPGKICFGLPMSLKDLTRIGSIIRELHDISASFHPSSKAVWDVAIPPNSSELICHNDLAPWNLVADGDRWVFIDWDASGPGSRLWDLAYATIGFLPIELAGDPERYAERLTALLSGYALAAISRSELIKTIERRARAGYDFLVTGAAEGREPWARLYEQGHGAYWGGVADYVVKHATILLKAQT